MQLHTFPWNLPGNSVVLHDIDLTSAKFTMDLISLLVALLSRDQIMTITHFIMLNLFYDISSCPSYLDIFNYLSYILTYAIIFSLTSCQENVFQITMKMHGSNLIHFTFMAPAVKFLHLMKTHSNY